MYILRACTKTRVEPKVYNTEKWGSFHGYVYNTVTYKK